MTTPSRRRSPRRAWASGRRAPLAPQWATPVLDEANPQTPSNYPTTRLGDTLNLRIFEFGDSNPGDAVHSGGIDVYSSSDSAAFRLYQDGELYVIGERAFGEVPVAPESRLRFELDVARDAKWWTTSTETHTAWEFDSATTETAQWLPMLQVDYDIDLDLNNKTKDPSKTKGPFKIGLDVRMPYSVDDTQIEDVKAWLSYDDGATWKKRPVRAKGDVPGVGARRLSGSSASQERAPRGVVNRRP